MTVSQRAGTTDLGFARLDTARAARTGDPEVVFGEGKTPEQVVVALRALREAHPDRAILATRLPEATIAEIAARLPEAACDPVGRTAVLGPVPARPGSGPLEPTDPGRSAVSPRPTDPDRPPGLTRGRVAIVAAGTSDLPVVRECAATVQVFGAEPDEIVDVGVAGLHRLLQQRDRIAEADVAVAVAGMEAALPSVLGGLVGIPLIAVPTSVGYGWNLDGVTAWLAAVNSCAPGVVTVNVDNGFGAGVAAARIARRTVR